MNLPASDGQSNYPTSISFGQPGFFTEIYAKLACSAYRYSVTCYCFLLVRMRYFHDRNRTQT